MPFDKEAYWANKGKPKPRRSVTSLVCGGCGSRYGPFEKKNGVLIHVGCPKVAQAKEEALLPTITRATACLKPINGRGAQSGVFECWLKLGHDGQCQVDERAQAEALAGALHQGLAARAAEDKEPLIEPVCPDCNGSGSVPGLGEAMPCPACIERRK